MKKVNVVALSILAVFLLIPLSHAAPAAETVSLMLDWYPNPDHVPIYVAAERGFFADEGLTVDIMAPADTSDPLKLVAAGKVDFGISYQPGVIIAAAEGLPVISIGALVQHPLSCIMYLKDSGLKSLAGLKGKKIGYSVEPLYRVLFEAAMEHAGVKSSDYETIHVGFNLSPPLLAGQVDAVIGAFRNYEAIQVAMEGKDVGIFPLEENGIPDFYELVMIAGGKMAKENPEKVRAFNRALAKGIEATLASPEEALKAFMKANPDSDPELTRRSFEATLPFFKGSPAQSPERWEAMSAFMLERGLISKRVPARDMTFGE